MTTLQGRIVTPAEVIEGEIAFGERIRSIRRRDAPASGHLPWIVPGFIDVHVHGGGGADAMDGPEGVRTLARFHLEHGTTTIYPTTITNPYDRVIAALEGIRQASRESSAGHGGGLPDIPGAHLEGPFISPDRLGAQPPYAIAPTGELVEAALATGAVRVVTLAPELPGALEAAERFARAGVRVSLGHTVAEYEVALRVLQRVASVGGTSGFTHLYNAMGGMEGRAPGVVGAAFASPQAWSELIADLHHVEPGSVLAALAAKGEKLALVTDAIRAAGERNATTELGGQTVKVRDGAARLGDGTLAGSVLTMDEAVRNLVSIGVPLPRASWAASGAAAAYMGLDDRGRIEPGLRADLVVLEPDLRVRAVYVGGVPTDPDDETRVAR